MTSESMWDYRQDQTDWADDRIIGYSVEATDGGIGKIDSRTTEAGAQSIVVDTSKLPLFGQKVMLPAGVVDRVDHEDKKVYVNVTKDRIKDAPDFDAQGATDSTYRDKIGGYYLG